MSKKIKFLLVASTCALVLLIVAVVAQSLIRQKQADRVLTSINESVAQADNKQKALLEALLEHKDGLEFVRTHQPIIKIGLQKSKAVSCDDLWWLFENKEELERDGWYIDWFLVMVYLDLQQCPL